MDPLPEFHPSLVQARRNLVLVLEDQGYLEEAADALRQAVQATRLRAEYAGLSGAPAADPRR